MSKKDVNVPVSGMSDAHPMNLKDSQYPFMLNGNIQTDINTGVTLTNEHSNILCLNFPSGYKVIGQLFVPEDNITYFFLVNPGVGSQIGYVTECKYEYPIDEPKQSDCDDCETENIEATPLEETVQVPCCTFVSVVTSLEPDDCLNFSLDFPIRKAVFKRDNCGDTIYFTDFHNPPRALKLKPDHTIDDTQRAIDHYEGTCPGDPNPVPVTPECRKVGAPAIVCTCCYPVYDADPTKIDCIKLRLFPQVEHICIIPDAVVPGGTLRAGTYQLAACYADSNGQRATRTFSCSNPVSVFDPNQTLTTQTDYPTDLAVKFLITELNVNAYRYIDIFVVGTINTVASFKQFATVDISSLVDGTLEYTVSTFEKGKDVTIDDLLQIFPVYDKAQEITSAGNTLLLGNLTGPRDLNLQEAAINISPFIRWESAEVNEWFYKDGANAAKYRGYLRDEVYAFGIVFERNNTLDTCVYPFIGRAINTVYDEAFVNAGNWIPFNVNYAPVGTYSVGDVAYFNGVSYVNTTGVNTTTDPATDAVNWLAITIATDLDVIDTEVISNNDVLEYPSCDTKLGADDKRWQVYNTGFNRGQPCTYKAGGVTCVQNIDTIVCASYQYAPTSIAITDIIGTFVVGETITWNGGLDSAVITFNNQGLGYLLVETASVTSAPVAGDLLVGGTSGATATVTSYLEGDTLPNDCYTDSAVTNANCADNYPTLYSDEDIQPIVKVYLIAPGAPGALVNGAFAGTQSGTITDASQQGAATDPYVLLRTDGSAQLTPGDTITQGANSALVKKVEGCLQNALPEGPPVCDPDHVRPNSWANPPLWSLLIAYNTGDVVFYNGHIYIALAPTVAGERPTDFPLLWEIQPSLCVDGQLALMPDDISIPYVTLRNSEEVEVSRIITADYYVYPQPSTIANTIPAPVDPTSTLEGNDTVGPFCVQAIYNFRLTDNTWLWREITFPTGDYPNYLGANAMGIVPVATNDCVGFVAPQSLPNFPMYFLGEYLADPGNPCGAGSGPCCPGGPDCDCVNGAGETDPNKYPEDPANVPPPASGSVGCWGNYWNNGALQIQAGTGEVNNTPYQSYWYSFTATATLTTVMIKARLVDAYNTPFGQDDIRIDVYAGTPSGTPVYSTGEDTVLPATWAYTNAGAERDAGVLICGDVAGSVSGADINNAAQQLPLTIGTVYYIHVYLLAPGRAKLNVAPVANPQHIGGDPVYENCPCYLPNYAYGNICVNYPKTNETKQVTLPAVNELRCTYDLYYRIQEVIDSGCLFQTYEFGEFAFTQSKTKRYPNDENVWGPLCGQLIRHFKFPDVLISKVHDQNQILAVPNNGRTAKTYPLGIMLDTEIIKAWLNWAATPIADGGPGKITEEEKLSITGYKIVRGNRAGNKSILGKGLLYDMWKYNEFEWVNGTFSSIPSWYPSYPFNDLRNDPFLVKNGTNFVHPFTGVKNEKFAFLSAETTFNGPTIGVELKFEAVNWGDSLGKFYQVRNHPKYILLSTGGIALATTMAALQLAADLLILIGQLLGNYEAGVVFTIPVGSIVGLVGAIINLAPNFFKYAADWNAIITNFGVPKNFAMYYAAVGNYHSSGVLGEVQNSGNKRRLIDTSSYLLAGNLSLNDKGVLIRINNYLREDSVFLSLNEEIVYSGTQLANRPDTSRFLMSSDFDGQVCSRGERQSEVASYYASIKYDVPDQYGSIHDIEWLYTGECKPIHWDETDESTCDPIYGGDTFICRMTQKRKLPFFIDTAVGVTTGVDFQYRRISNITDAKFYFNSVGESTLNSGGIQFKEVEHKFDCEDTGGLYLNGSIYLFSYGITSFITESDFNLNYRYAEDNKFRTFYPFQSDIENWTQETKVPIETPNAYLYNRGYSKQNKENFFCTQPAIYSNADCITTYRNRVINSIPDADSDFYSDPWRIFLANDYADFPLVNGQLIGMDGIEREKVMLRFNNTTLVFNAYYTMTTDAGVAQIGTASMFAQKPLEYAKTELGYGGTQHHAFTSTQFGHFWVDAKRSAVFMLPPESGLIEISLAFQTFFNNNLPFFIVKYFPTYPVDNNYKNVGITLVWDNKFDRLILTKLDFELLPQWRSIVRTNLDDLTPTTPIIVFNDAGQLDAEGGEAGVIYYVTINAQEEITIIEISLTDPVYFCNKSWTIGYSPLTKTWISYYSFVPNYYVSHESYFQSGINFPQSGDNGEIGLWNHLITNKSYQVFYGKLNPFITDVVVKDQLINKQLHSVEYQADFLRFQNDYDYFYNTRVTFNKMVIWSENRNTGNLELVPQVPNNMAQALLYPQSNPNSTTILVTRKENNWRVNQFGDLVANKDSNVPPMIYGCHPYLKQVNPAAINYYKPTFKKQRLTSDYMTLRFINDAESNYKIINKWFINNIMKSYS